MIGGKNNDDVDGNDSIDGGAGNDACSAEGLSTDSCKSGAWHW